MEVIKLQVTSVVHGKAVTTSLSINYGWGENLNSAPRGINSYQQIENKSGVNVIPDISNKI